jgi:hypothetical protein
MRTGALPGAGLSFSRPTKKPPIHRRLENSEMATPIGFEPTISTVTGWHVNRYTTGP